MQPELALDQRGDGMYSGSFRWTEHKQFPALPRRSGAAAPTAPLAIGWQGYLGQCHATSLLPWATNDPSFLDALSFPMTLVYMTKLLNAEAAWPPGRTVTILVVGATVKAEQRIWNHTNYWAEISAFYPDRAFDVWFIGPEVSMSVHGGTAKSRVTAHAYRGTTGSFLASHDVDVATTVVIGYNTGFGNFVESGRYDLLWSWLPDLYAIVASGLLSIFACANDYADMNGEFAVHTRVLGSNMAYLPRDNPFSAASHLHEDGKRESAWSRANSFVYAIQGGDRTRQQTLDLGDLKRLSALLDAEAGDTHLIDRVGRHCFRGMVLSKEQAARCKLLQQKKPPPVDRIEAADVNKDDTDKRIVDDNSDANQNQTRHQNKVETLEPVPPMEEVIERMVETTTPMPCEAMPQYELISTMDNAKMTLTIHTPALASVRDMALDVSSDMLQFVVPGVYRLQVALPWAVDNATTRPTFSKKARRLVIALASPTA
ncbi:hypothetical protein SPRG_11668 [Saprolegnia parasitica CBS 223.65]|uniref:Uncharacterized protein n=1 Tax=Saprolegnia parasitica (strain CBS 223.65) TaxID=695850 RepID=A0A067C2I6_SAPPC|nr:hypothetical protein SPRG_11668 [Saprolegnia parasitica CBS 223.65]KDO23355.1 hypothetical protein SPRG_11668 [Saprolegnia parasitica CBS 223.65]|eukprot:XP_012206004.1 hypothetical protein SPRG_11668 [Saprolegnia parasitica CBS 223.65]